MTSHDDNPHRYLYDGIASWYVNTFYDDFSDRDWLDLFAQIVPRGEVIADIGSGPGQYAQFFRDCGFRSISMDLSFNMLTSGREVDPHLHPVVSEISKIPLAEASLGGLLAAYTLEHVTKEETIGITLQEIARVVRPGGAAAVMVKCGEGLYEFQSSLVPGAKGFVQLWNIGDLSYHLKVAGFDIVFIDHKDPVSPEEFKHPRGFILARRRCTNPAPAC